MVILCGLQFGVDVKAQVISDRSAVARTPLPRCQPHLKKKIFFSLATLELSGWKFGVGTVPVKNCTAGSVFAVPSTYLKPIWVIIDRTGVRSGMRFTSLVHKMLILETSFLSSGFVRHANSAPESEELASKSRSLLMGKPVEMNAAKQFGWKSKLTPVGCLLRE